MQDDDARQARREEQETRALMYDLERVKNVLMCQEMHRPPCQCSEIGTMRPAYVVEQAMKKITDLSGIL